MEILNYSAVKVTEPT